MVLLLLSGLVSARIRFLYKKTLDGPPVVGIHEEPSCGRGAVFSRHNGACKVIGRILVMRTRPVFLPNTELTGLLRQLIHFQSKSYSEPLE